jgi:uncharacterized protein (TIGR02246 family)
MKMIVAATCAWVLAAAAAQAAPASADDESALRTLAASVDGAWDRKDINLMAASYSEDATLLVGGAGQLQQGRPAVQAYFQKTFAQRAGVMRHVSELRGIDMLGPDLAVTDIRVRVEARQPDGGWKEVRRFDNLSMAVRENGSWKLRVVRAYPLN